jgi:hypothetical protein
MALNIRIPFDDIIASRDATLDKDSIISNAFCDQVTEGTTIVKRPGLINKTSALGLGISGALGLGQGIFFFNDKVYSWNSATTDLLSSGFAKNSTKALILGGYSGTPPERFQLITIDLDGKLTASKRLTPGVAEGFPTSLVYTGTSFITSVAEPADNKFYRSTDNGSSWSLLSGPNGSGAYYGVVRGTTICFFTPGAPITIQTSIDDGINWTTTTPATTSFSTAINTLGSVFTIGTHHSSNGTSWTASTGATTMHKIWSNGSYLVGFSDTGVYKFTNNGTTWVTASKLGTGASSMNENMDLVWNGTFWCGVTSNGKSVTSSDGTNWVLGNRNIGNQVPNVFLTYFDSTFYCISQTNPDPFTVTYLETSTDGINWTREMTDTQIFNQYPTVISGLA